MIFFLLIYFTLGVNWTEKTNKQKRNSFLKVKQDDKPANSYS